MVARLDDAETRKAFAVEYVANGGRAHEAALAVGFARSRAGVQGRKLLAREDVQAAIEAELRRQLDLLAPAAVQVLDRLMRDESIPAKVRLAAANAILDRGNLRRGQQVAHVHTIDPAGLIAEIWEQRQARLAAQESQVIDIMPESVDGP